MRDLQVSGPASLEHLCVCSPGSLGRWFMNYLCQSQLQLEPLRLCLRVCRAALMRVYLRVRVRVHFYANMYCSCASELRY